MTVDDNLVKKIKVARVKCDNDLMFFTRYFFKRLRGVKFIKNWHHSEITAGLSLVEKYELELLNINIPPRMSKTELVLNFIARGLGRNPSGNYLYITASDELRSETSTRIRDIISDDHFKLMYGVELKKDQRAKNLWRTTQGGGLKTATIFGQITGFGAGQMIDVDKELMEYIRNFEGCIVLDDINKIDDATARTAANAKTIRILFNTILSRKNSSDTPIINIQQRAGTEDATDALLKYFQESEKVKNIVLPAVIDGKSIWEWKLPMSEIKRLQENELTSSVFETQYMQNPTNPEGLLLPINELRFENLSSIPEECIIFRFSISDPANTGGDKYSNPFLHVAEIEGRIVVYVKDVIHTTDGIEAAVERIPTRIIDNDIEALFLEENGVGLAAALLIKKKLPANVKFAPFHSSIKKETRILSHYEFVKRFFIFDENYKDSKEYKLFIGDATSYEKDGDNAHKIDAIDVLCSAANIVKLKYHKIIYSQ